MEAGIDLAQDAASHFERDKWPFYWLTRVVALYLEQLDVRLKKIGLDVSRWRVLMCLGESNAIGVSEIAELAIVKLSTMMKVVQRMEADGLVEMSPRATDGRVTEVALTGQGQAARAEALAVARRIHDRCFADFPVKDRERLNDYLRTIFLALEA